jgi:glutathione S-transferase
MQTRPIVYGAAYSVYVQAVRLTLWAKQVPYDLVEVDVFGPAGPPAEYLSRHPFGRIPSFEHDGFRIYETASPRRTGRSRRATAAGLSGMPSPY